MQKEQKFVIMLYFPYLGDFLRVESTAGKNDNEATAGRHLSGVHKEKVGKSNYVVVVIVVVVIVVIVVVFLDVVSQVSTRRKSAKVIPLLFLLLLFLLLLLLLSGLLLDVISQAEGESRQK